MTPRLRTLLATLGAAAITAAAPAVASAADPYISEIHYDNAGADTGEAIEVTGTPGASLAGWSVVLYNGANGQPYNTRALSGALGADGTVVLSYPTDGIQNGAPDGVALVGPSGVTEFLSYEGVLTATAGPAAGTQSTDIGVAETGTTPAGFSLQRDAAGVWRGPAENTFVVPQGPCSGSLTAIAVVQGAGDASPCAGAQAIVEGVVTSVFPGLNGVFVQDPAGDGDPATSEGLFVFGAATRGLQPGDVVRAAGRVLEFARGGRTGTLTELSANTVEKIGTAAVPAPLPVALGGNLEPYEGMLVRITDELFLTEYFQFDDFGEVRASAGGVLQTPTEVAEPGAEARAVMAANAARTITIDDGRSASFQDIDGLFGATREDPIRRGDRVSGVTGALHFDFGVFRIQPTETVIFSDDNQRTPAPAVAGDIKIASFNVLNYFTTLGSRGAATAEEFQRQQAKIVAAINGLGADVVALQEIESKRLGTTDVNEPTQALVAALNAAAGGDVWAGIPIPANFTGTDVITVSIIYRKAAVTAVGAPVALPDPAFANARQPIAQTFDARGDRFTVVANHFKSKGSCPSSSTSPNADRGDGQGCFNADRVKQAEALAAFVTRLQDSTDDDDVLVLGDLNAYTREDPLDVLRAAGLLDQRRDLPESERYSYVFDGGQGVLDHALATETLDARRVGAAAWHLNADEPDAYEYDGFEPFYSPTPYRSSDHDPLLLGYARAAAVCDGREATIAGTDAAETLYGTSRRDVIYAGGGDDVVIGANGDDVICGGAGDDRVEGGSGDDVLVGDSGDDVLRGGNGDDRIRGGAGDDQVDGGRGRDTVTQD